MLGQLGGDLLFSLLAEQGHGLKVGVSGRFGGIAQLDLAAQALGDFQSIACEPRLGQRFVEQGGQVAAKIRAVAP